MTSRRANLILRGAAVLALVGLVCMVWSVVQPTPLPVMLAMTVGQGAGTLSFLMFLLVVIADLHRARVLDPPKDDDHSGGGG
jgi:hypothetical protein